ncbi:hydroxyacylglutathione hydrolase [Anaerococcus sp. AGMB00486]|uniref:Hydroxyacylglutathione hydrolase n=1 Tax=Anaerococcus faecalis TaxID=2742993 RepID=A0ABX2N6T1_9FIRM|nr:hydroxyacylglutathione hydrolase [Anaerococcus faecalis]NVF10413.1 hydroxyacylglutathione hydrolase [Anaerococcus faecalis]
MKIKYIKALKDNYIWAIEKANDIIIIDPGETRPVLEYIKGKNLVGILITHKHMDHIGGVSSLKEKYKNSIVIGPIETEDLNDKTVKDGDEFELLGFKFKVIKTDGHTEEHISYLTENNLFCGDTIFSSGCGRVFTKKYDRSFNSVKKIKNLSMDTLIYPAHEYTIDCLKSSKKIIKDKIIDDAINEAQEKIDKGLPSLPTSVEKEYRINPFFMAKDLNEFKEYIRIKN